MPFTEVERPDLVPPPQKSSSTADFWYILPFPFPLPAACAFLSCSPRPERAGADPAARVGPDPPATPQKSSFVLDRVFAAPAAAGVPPRLAERSLQSLSTSWTTGHYITDGEIVGNNEFKNDLTFQIQRSSVVKPRRTGNSERCTGNT